MNTDDLPSCGFPLTSTQTDALLHRDYGAVACITRLLLNPEHLKPTVRLLRNYSKPEGRQRVQVMRQHVRW
jgi:hypothetical protein